jgi:site-specific recombinase XerD
MLNRGADVRYVGELLGRQALETTTVDTRVSLAKQREGYGRFHLPRARGPDLPGE